MDKWLFDILKNNTLLDNQTYRVNDGVFSNYRLNKQIQLLAKTLGGHRKPWNDEDAIWSFLNTTCLNIQKALSENKDNSVVLFKNKEYEHNTDDSLINLQGINCRNFTLETGNLIGYIKENEFELKISSRFGDNFLKVIIADAEGFVEIDDYGGDKDGGGYEWLLIYLWKIKLKKAFRLGLPKLYKSHNEVLTKVKGRIDPMDYFMNGKSGRYKCDYREQSYNNLPVKLIATALNKIKGNSFTTDIHSVKQAFNIATKGERVKPSALFKTPYFSNPFYSDYNSVIDLSKMILKDELADFGKKSDSNAFFFDISMLFEYYIRKLLLRKGHQLQSKFEKRKEIFTGAIGSYKRKLEPDIVIEHNQKIIVLDVKYKAYDFRYGVKREDLFQLHTYIGQYGNHSEIAGCGFIYPISRGKWGKETNCGKKYSISSDIHVMGKQIPFTIFFLVIPDNNSADYHTEFNKTQNIFINTIHSAIEEING